VRHTGHDTGTITVAGVGRGGTTMSHVAENVGGVLEDAVGVLSLDVGDKTDTARVLLVHGVIETLLDGEGTGPGAVALDVVAVHESFHFDEMCMLKKKGWVVCWLYRESKAQVMMNIQKNDAVLLRIQREVKSEYVKKR